MKNLLALCVVALLCGCAGMDIFGAPDEDIQNGLISGKPFEVDQAKHPVPICKSNSFWTCSTVTFDKTKPITVTPVDPQSDLGLQMRAMNVKGGTRVLTNSIWVLQSYNIPAMLSVFYHEYGNDVVAGHLSGGRHAGDADHTGSAIDQRTANLERERAINCARLGIACY